MLHPRLVHERRWSATEESPQGPFPAKRGRISWRKSVQINKCQRIKKKESEKLDRTGNGELDIGSDDLEVANLFRWVFVRQSRDSLKFG